MLLLLLPLLLVLALHGVVVLRASSLEDVGGQMLLELAMFVLDRRGGGHLGRKRNTVRPKNKPPTLTKNIGSILDLLQLVGHF